MGKKKSRCLKPVYFAVLFALLLMSSPGVARSSTMKVVGAEARAEATKLINKVSRITRSHQVSASAQTDWVNAAAGDPILVYSFNGVPTTYLVPVIDHRGTTVSTVGVSAATGRWCWYNRYTAVRFPVISAGEARAKAKAFLRSKGVNIRLPDPQARMAPDKLVYWCFVLGGRFPIKRVYVPVFYRGSASSNIQSAFRDQKLVPGRPAVTAEEAPERSAGTAGTVGIKGGLTGGAAVSHNIKGVPYHQQQMSYWCGPAVLQMIFDYWGPNVSQKEIAAVAVTESIEGSYDDDLLRAAQFSSQSTAVNGPFLRGYSSRSTGYGAAAVHWADRSPLYGRRYSDLKELISRDIPVAILSSYDTPPSQGHFRLVKGYDDTVGSFIVHDPWYSSPYSGPDVNFNQSFLVDTLWKYSDRWGMIACPWEVDVVKPSRVTAGEEFKVTATVSYKGPPPMDRQFPCIPGTAVATIKSSASYRLTGGAAEQRVSGVGSTGSKGLVSWSMRALDSRSTNDIRVSAQGMIEGHASSYESYSDIIGGVGSSSGAPPTTTRAWGHDSVGATAPARHWFLAEGSTRGGFETWVLVQNPGGSAARVALTYMTPDGPIEGPRYTLPARSRKSFSVADLAPGQWSVSTRVTSNRPVVAERAMYWGGYRVGHDSIGVTKPARHWYLAEGCTKGGSETWVLVQNPGRSAANVALTYMTPSGPVPGPRARLEPNTRRTFNVADSAPDRWSVSTMVTSDTGVVAERAVYGDNRSWGTDSIGADAPARQWYLAEGCTGTGFESWIVVQNPNGAPAHIALTYMTADNTVPGPSVVMPGNSRRTFNVADTVPGNWEVSTRVTSDRPVVAERAMYGGGRNWGHDSIGVPRPAATWYLAEGCTHSGFETWVLVQNPTASSARVKISYMTSRGLVRGPTVTLRPRSRKTFNVASTVPDEWEVSTMVQSANGVPVIAERAMYGDER